jgi:uncharacterized protein (DUF849 family)
MLIKAAINGGRSRVEHAAVPVTPEDQARAVIDCLRAGAGAIHLHIRSTTGDPAHRESLLPADVVRTLTEVRSASREAQIGVSTGTWIMPDAAARFAAVKAWEVLPDFASVNFCEEGAVELAALLLSRDVGVEAGLCAAADAEVLMRSGLAKRCIRTLIEPQEQTMESALGNVCAIEEVLQSLKGELSLLLHGTEVTVWPMIDEAIARGYDVRVGLEDTLVLPDGSPALSNVELVAEAVRRVSAASFPKAVS